MIVDDVIKKSRSWVSSRGVYGIVVSSRIRLARNVSGAVFPWRAGSDQSKLLFGKLAAALTSLETLKDAVVLPMEDISDVDREVLCERRIISSEMINKGAGSGVVIANSQRVAVMINEEDHLRMQVIRPGLNLMRAWKLLDSVDSELEHLVSYAFSPELGYLTACPSNVGIGMRVSVMLHLPGLKLMGETDQVIRGLNRMGMAVRGTFGEGSDDFGNMYQVSNQPTLGVSELDVVKRVNDVAKTLEELESNARARLMESRKLYVRDYVNRAYGISRYAEVISSGEALDLLSALRFGVEFDMLSGVSLSRITELMLLLQPGHLQKNANDELSVEDRDTLRAILIRRRLKDIEIKGIK